MQNEDEIKVADSASANEATWVFKEQVTKLTEQNVRLRQELAAIYGERDFLRTIVSRQAGALEGLAQR